MKLKIIGFFIGFCVIFLSRAFPAETDKISLTEAFQTLERQNPTLRQARLRMEQAATALAAEKSAGLPTLGIQLSYNYISEVANFKLPLKIPGVTAPEIEAGVNNQYGVSAVVRQPIFTGFRLRNRRLLADNQVMQSEARLRQVQNQLKRETARLFYQLHSAGRSLEILDAGINRVRVQREMTINLYRAGQAEAFDTLKMASEYLRLFTEKNKLAHTREALLAGFNALLNSDAALDAGGYEKKEVLAPGPITVYLNEALLSRPELSSVDLQKKAALFSKKIAASAYLPQISGQLSYHYARPGINFFKDEWMDYYAVGVNLQWELWNWKKTKNQVRHNQLQLNILNEEENALVLNIRNEIIRAAEDLKSGLEINALLDQLLRQELERYRIIQAKFERGLATALDLTDAENALRAAEIQFSQNNLNLLIYQVELDYATGKIGQN